MDFTLTEINQDGNPTVEDDGSPTGNEDFITLHRESDSRMCLIFDRYGDDSDILIEACPQGLRLTLRPAGGDPVVTITMSKDGVVIEPDSCAGEKLQIAQRWTCPECSGETILTAKQVRNDGIPKCHECGCAQEPIPTDPDWHGGFETP